MLTSAQLREGEVYTREDLKNLFGITDQTLYTGIFKPTSHNSIWLFVTERKSGDMTDYSDVLQDNMLYWDGQTSGRKDQMIVEHERQGLEILVFYRVKKLEFPGAGFRYQGRFRYVSHTGGGPAHFVLERFSV